MMETTGRCRLAAIAIATALLVWAAPSARIQTEVKLRVDPAPDWEIVLSPDAVLEGDWVERSNVNRLDSERLLFVPVNQADGFWVVSTDGSSAERIGRAGDGPGEYRYILSAVPHESGIHIFDVMAFRRTVLNTDFEVLHTSPLQLRMNASRPAVLDDFTYVANGSISRRPGAEEHVLHYFDASGDVIRSFDWSPLEGASDYRALSTGPDGTLWSAHRNQYRVDRWDVDGGRRTTSLVRNADWFVPHSGGGGGYHPQNPPPPQLLEIGFDPDGRLWTQITVASDRWEEAFVRTGPDDHPEFGEFRLDADEIAFDTVIEVIDPATGCVLATRTFDDIPYLYFLGSGLAAASHADDVNPRWQLWRMELQPMANGDGQPCD